MPVIAVVGAQWGDEGKGRVVDYLAATCGELDRPVDVVIRFQGGDNAGPVSYTHLTLPTILLV